MSALALLLALSPAPQDAALAAARAHWSEHGHSVLAEFVELLALPCADVLRAHA